MLSISKVLAKCQNNISQGFKSASVSSVEFILPTPNCWYSMTPKWFPASYQVLFFKNYTMHFYQVSLLVMLLRFSKRLVVVATCRSSLNALLTFPLKSGETYVIRPATSGTQITSNGTAGASAKKHFSKSLAKIFIENKIQAGANAAV